MMPAVQPLPLWALPLVPRAREYLRNMCHVITLRGSSDVRWAWKGAAAAVSGWHTAVSWCALPLPHHFWRANALY